MTAIVAQSYLPPYVIGYDKPPTPTGRSRCHHLMLDGECSWCLGHPEVGEEDCE